MRIQGEEQVRARSVRRRICQCNSVHGGWMRLPAMPVAQMPRARQAGLARMALLAVELAQQADAYLVLKRRNARNRAETRRAAHGTQAPSDAHTRRNRAKTRHFRGFLGVFRGPGGAEIGPPGWVLPGDKRLRAAGRSRLIDHSWFQCPSAFGGGRKCSRPAENGRWRCKCRL